MLLSPSQAVIRGRQSRQLAIAAKASPKRRASLLGSLGLYDAHGAGGSGTPGHHAHGTPHSHGHGHGTAAATTGKGGPRKKAADGGGHPTAEVQPVRDHVNAMAVKIQSAARGKQVYTGPSTPASPGTQTQDTSLGVLYELVP